MAVEQSSRPSRRTRVGDSRRRADRHYVAVVAAEARRLARQMRPSSIPPTTRRPH